MGTRHFIGVIHNGQYKIAQYGQWDGYISGQGAVVLDFLSKANLDVFRQKLENCKWITDKELRQKYVEAGDRPDNQSGFIEMHIALRFNEMYPSLSRDTGANILNIVYESTSEVPLLNREDFLQDDVFCEFAYVINLDRNTLHCYSGGKKMFAEYIIEDLPTVDQMQYDFDKHFECDN
jgi:hypothetical protein